MGFSIAGSQGASTVLAELSLAEAGTAQEAEGLTLPQELTDAETLQQKAQEGMLRGESKEYAFVKQQATDIPRKFSEALLEMNRPEQNKLADPKSPLHHLAFKEESVKEKVFKTIEPHKPHLEKNTSQGQTPGRTQGQSTPLQSHDKAHQAARQALAEAKTPPSPARLRENALKQQQNSSRTLEQRVHKELAKQETRESKDPQKATEGRKESRSAERQNGPQESQGRFDKNLDKNEEREQRERREREEEEGFADGGQRHSQQEEHSDGKYTSDRTSKIDAVFAKEFNGYAAEESILSQIFNMRVSQFDVLILFLEIMKLDIKSRELQKLARRDERALQLMHMQKVVDNYKEQSKWQLFSSLGSGVLSIVSGAAPIAGHMKGDWILEKLGGVFSSLRDMKKDQFFKGITKITFAMSEMYKSTGQIQNTFSEGHRTFDQHMSELYRADWDESTRTMEEIKDNWKGIENFLYQNLQMYHEAIRSLYN